MAAATYPLTSVFTPASTCLETITYSKGDRTQSTQLQYGFISTRTARNPAITGDSASALILDPSCYPPHHPETANFGSSQAVVYSPGICPSGYTSACGYTKTLSGGNVQTNIGCCPPHTQYLEDLYHSQIKKPIPQTATLQCDLSSLPARGPATIGKCTWAKEIFATKIVITSALTYRSANPASTAVHNLTIYNTKYLNQHDIHPGPMSPGPSAIPIVVAYQSSDSEILRLMHGRTAAPHTSHPRHPAPTKHATGSSTTALPIASLESSILSDGLTSNAQIGAGIGAGLGTIIVALIGVIIWLLMRQRKRTAKSLSEPESSPPANRPSSPNYPSDSEPQIMDEKEAQTRVDHDIEQGTQQVLEGVAVEEMTSRNTLEIERRPPQELLASQPSLYELGDTHVRHSIRTSSLYELPGHRGHTSSGPPADPTVN